MFGNKHGGDEIAKEFFKLIKNAMDAEEPAASMGAIDDEDLDVPAENFLISKMDEPLDESSSALDGAIESFSDDEGDEDDEGDDEAEETCDCSPKCKCKPQECDCMDMGSFASNNPANKILFGLGKIARDLRNKGEGFAADMVEVTALDISKDLAEEASKNMFVINELKKVEASFDKNSLESDLVKAAIEKIKRS